MGSWSMPFSLITFKSSLLSEKWFQANLWDIEEYHDMTWQYSQSWPKLWYGRKHWTVWWREGLRSSPGGECYPQVTVQSRVVWFSGSLKVIKLPNSHRNGVGDLQGVPAALWPEEVSLRPPSCPAPACWYPLPGSWSAASLSKQQYPARIKIEGEGAHERLQ